MDLELQEKSSKSKKSEKKSFPAKIMSWIGRHELSVLLAILLIIAGLWLAAELADGVIDGRSQELDTELIMSLREGENGEDLLGPPWLEEMMRDFTSLGGTGILTLIALTVSIYYLIQERYKELLFIIIAVVGAYVLSFILKGIFERPRPQFIPDGEYKYTTSFPSGHALLAAATYLTLASIVAQLVPRYRTKAFILLIGIFIMVLVGFSRVYLGVHWPTDVLAGWAIGIVWATFIWLVFRALKSRGTVEEVPDPNGEDVEVSVRKIDRSVSHR